MSAARRAGPRRSVATLAPALVLALAVSGALAATPAATPAAAAVPTAVRAPGATAADPGADAALDRLRDDASGDLDVSRDETGSVVSVVSADGGAVLESGTSDPEETVSDQLGVHGEVFGLDGETSRAEVTQVLPSATGGSIVRAEQVVSGLPVFGGQVVAALDDEDEVVSLTADTLRGADELEVTAPRVPAALAQRTAAQVVARDRDLAVGSLATSLVDRVVYDPSILGTADPVGARAAWQVEVRGDAGVRETVLVGTDRGEVALRLDAAPRATDRWVCDHQGRQLLEDHEVIPVCEVPTRREGDPQAPVDPFDPDAPHPDVQLAYEHLGEAATTYADLRPGTAEDLTELVGTEVDGRKRLVATVRWCVSNRACPYANAFWDGHQMVFGEGYAGADDVVAHELTHGFIEATSGLFYFQQSGALNESLADVVGEVVDQRHGADDDSAWTMGEDLPGGALRSLADPARDGLPDTMTSPAWKSASWNATDSDLGGVHHNLGVGNRTAYLISQGGSVGGRTLRGIDDGDPGLTKTGTLYLEVIPRLSPGAQYADLGRVLVATCRQLAEASAAGFTDADCETVAAATEATELSSPPTAAGSALGEAARECPTGTTVRDLAVDDDARDDFDWDTTENLWEVAGRGPDLPAYAREGRESLLGFNPDPTAYGDPPVSTARSRELTLPRNAGGSFLHFHHAFALDHRDGTYYDGATVDVLVLRSGEWVPAAVPTSAWVNGPDRSVVGQNRFTGFGGDSRGWGSSRLDLTAFAGQDVRLQLRLEADDSIAELGWWVDDVSLYSCEGAAPTSPRAATARVSGNAVTLSWQPPLGGAAPVGYQVTRSDSSSVLRLPASARSTVLRGFSTASDAQVAVAAVARGGQVGLVATQRVEATTATVSAAARVRKARPFTVTGRVVQRGTSVGVRGVLLTLQRKQGRRAWSTVARASSGADGTARWTVRQRPRLVSYRVVAATGPLSFATTSAARTVRRR